MASRIPSDREISPPPLKRRKAETVKMKKETFQDFFKPVTQKQREKTEKPETTKGQIVWSVVKQTCLCGRFGVPTDREDTATSSGETEIEAAKDEAARIKRRIVAFDFDGTLVRTKSGFKYARSGDDWTWWSPSIPSRLQELHRHGYLLAILTNQKAVSVRKQLIDRKPDSKSLTNLKKRLSGVIEALDLPMMVYAATEDDCFRKPSRGMWNELVGANGFNIEDELDLEASIFVGDAAGRKGDHSAVDRDFAANAGISFQTPEEAFLDQQRVEAIEVVETRVATEQEGQKTTGQWRQSSKTMDINAGYIHSRPPTAKRSH
ncbi:hypothetical protein KEM56_004449 [Ascosphaera pollenicola]|nr:hypothetical protein KEM56_004449 [Ascosphaera pollenicola]